MNIKYIVIVVAVIALGTAVFASTRNNPATVPTASVASPTAYPTIAFIYDEYPKVFEPLPRWGWEKVPNKIYGISYDGFWSPMDFDTRGHE